MSQLVKLGVAGKLTVDLSTDLSFGCQLLRTEWLDGPPLQFGVYLDVDFRA
jgi:hypothetical protein